MKAGKTEIIAIVDRSGSMMSIKDDAIGSFNALLDDQKKQPGECQFTYTHFNQHYEVVKNGIPIQQMEPLNNNTYVPAGMTAMLDAIGRTVDDVGERLRKTPEHERPEQVILVILTDGEENSSTEYSWERVAEMLKHQTEKYGWRVIFLAQNLDSAATARKMGLNVNLANVFVANMAGGSKGWARGVRAASYAVSSTRSSGHMDKSGTSALLATDEPESPPKPNRSTGKGIARAQAERDKQSRRRRSRSGEPDLD